MAAIVLGEGLRQLESASIETYRRRVEAARAATELACLDAEAEAKDRARARARRGPGADQAAALFRAGYVDWTTRNDHPLYSGYWSRKGVVWQQSLSLEMPAPDDSRNWRARVELECVRAWRILPREPGPVLIRALGAPDDDLLVSALKRRFEELGVPCETRVSDY